MGELGYGPLDRLLHRLVLQYPAIAEMTFELDQRFLKARPDIRGLPHVFVSGLARSGTTILMRRFHQTGCFRSLTYGDMPFVLAPYAGRWFSRRSEKVMPAIERAHGDALLVDRRSPESLDEVFWRVFANEEYIFPGYLKPHVPSDGLLQKFVHFVQAILATGPSQSKRYLSKNNNNLLRLGAIHRAFPNALFILLFRDPLQHAYSLLLQHQRFCELQRNDKFVTDYMRWLVHHEFGTDHRPFRFDGPQSNCGRADSFDYWLEYWCEVYLWVLNNKPARALLVRYESLSEAWSSLIRLAGIEADGKNEAAGFVASERPVPSVDDALARRAASIYERLSKAAGKGYDGDPVWT